MNYIGFWLVLFLVVGVLVLGISMADRLRRAVPDTGKSRPPGHLRPGAQYR